MNDKKRNKNKLFNIISARSHSSVWLERGANNAKVVGSIPTGTKPLFPLFIYINI